MDFSNLQLNDILTILGVMIAIGLVLSLLFLGWVFYKVRNLNVPPDADFFEALRLTPLSVVILLDLLDMTLDFFAAPFAWIILSRLGLEPLRAVTMVHSFVPGTQLLPVMTASWVIARVWKNTPRLPRYPSR